MTVQLLRAVTVLLGDASSVVRDSPKSFWHIKCIPDSPLKWQDRRYLKAAPKL